MTEAPHTLAVDRRAAVLLRIHRLLRAVVAATAAILAVWLLSDVLVVVFAAALLAVILHGVANLLHRATGLPYWLALVAVLLVLLAAVTALVLLAGPGLVEQATKLWDALGGQLHGLHDRLGSSRWGQLLLKQVPTSLGGDAATGGDGKGVPSGLAGSVAGFLGTVFGLAGTCAVVLIAAVYFAAAPGTYVNGAMRLVAVRHRPRAKALCQAAGHALWAWSAGQALDMLVVGLLSALGLWLIGVPLAPVLGILAGLMNFVPYIGAIIGAIPALLIAFSAGATPGLETIGLYVVVQAFEGNVMAPLIQRRAVHLPPALTLLAQTAFGVILGVPGLIFATPLTAALLAVMERATVPLDDADKV